MRRYLLFLFLAAAVWGQNVPRITLIRQNGTNPIQLSPNTIAVVFGTDFGTQAKIAVNGIPAEVTFSAPTNVTFRIPPNTEVGQASVVATTTAGSSAPFPFVLIPVSPSIILDSLNSPAAYYHYAPGGQKNLFPQPADVVSVYVVGLGVSLPPPSATVVIDGVDFPIAGATNVPGAIFGGPTATPTLASAISFKIPDLQPGRHLVAFQAGGVNSGSIPLDLLYSGIITSQTGLTFTTVQNGPAPGKQTLVVLSGVGTIDFNLTTSTVSGGSWLSVTPASGSARAGQTGVPILVSVDPTGLAAGPYYGSIQVTAQGVLNSPQTITVVLRIAPVGTSVGAYLESAGLIFSGTQTAADPAAQTLTIANPTPGNLTYTSTLTITAGTNQWRYTPLSATIPSGQTATVSVQASLAGAAPGVHTARINLSFSDGSVRFINLLLVVVSNSAPKPISPLDADGCKPTKLLPLFTQPGASFSVPAAWPTPIVVSVVDDCAVPLTTGSVSVSFGNGDPTIQMSSLRNGSFAGTWPAVNARSTGFSITATANDPASALTGSISQTGVVGANPEVPIISRGGVVDAASNGPALSPGSLITVYGSKLSGTAGAANGLPWGNLLNSTTLLLGGKPLPLYYTSDGQVNAMVPYDVAQNTSQQLVARNGNALSSPQAALIVPVRPAVFVMDAAGQGAIVGNSGLANASAPVKPGEIVVVYCTGLGPVDPPVQAGVAASLTTLSRTANPVTATVGGVAATVLFAGVTPGFSGLYQVNLTVPATSPDNNATPLVLTAGGQSSTIVTFAVRR